MVRRLCVVRLYTEIHLIDCLIAGIPWLENKYKQYVVMRERVLTETQALRERLLNAVPDMCQPQQRNEIMGAQAQTHQLCLGCCKVYHAERSGFFTGNPQLIYIGDPIALSCLITLQNAAQNREFRGMCKLTSLP